MSNFYSEVCIPRGNIMRFVLKTCSASPQISSIQDTISQYSANVTRISDLQSRALNSTDENQNRQNAGILDDLVSQTRDLGNSIKQRIQSLDTQPAQPGENIAIRKNQVFAFSCESIYTLIGA